MKKGFTLAEVLITLAVIGVVAALTIPTVVHKYQQKQLYTQFMKAYNTLSTALNLSIAENGSIDNWTKGEMTDEEFFKQYLGKYLKVSSYCTGNYSNCGLNYSGNLHPLNAEGDIPVSLLNEEQALLTLQDGMMVDITSFDVSDGIEITVDTNGSKGPNTFGRDIFDMIIEKIGDKTVLIPRGLYSRSAGYRTLAEIIDSGDPEKNCTTSSESYGSYCGARLLLEGKMDY